MKAGIALDDWKLPIFRKHLTDAGYSYVDAGEMMPGVTLLHVDYTDQTHLAGVVQAANNECARTGKPQP